MPTLLTLLTGCIGLGLAQLAPSLPPRAWSVAALGIALALGVALLLRRRPPPLALAMLLAAIIGANYAWLRADLRLADALPRAWEGRDIDIVGIVDELPQSDEQGTRFAFAVERVLTPDAHVPSRIALGWYRERSDGKTEPPAEIHAGERWQLTVRLKRPHGYANPGSFDVEAWLLENDLRATGSVRGDEPNRRLTANAGRAIDHLNRLRERIRQRMQMALAGQPHGGVLIALAIGDQRAVPAAQWALFNATAVSHLLSISGAHVTLFAGWVGWLVLALWRRSQRLMQRLPAQQAAALVAAIIAVAYAALAGFEVPAQRTCYMLLAAALALCLRRTLAPSLILVYALVAVLLLDPWAVLAVGFWFSFLAVAFLLYVNVGRVGARRWWRTVLASQAAVTLGLAPITIALFGQVSLIGPIANAVAIPLITMLVVPLTLLWLVLPIDALLALAQQLIAWLVVWLQWLITWPAAVWSQHAPPWWSVALALLGGALLLAPRGWPHPWLGALWCLPLFAITPTGVAEGEFRLVALDVGQGTAAVVQTAKHTLVFDTGARWNDQSDVGSRLIAPWLRASGLGRIDGLVVSHLDLDHSGGALSLLNGVPTGWLLTSIAADTDIVTAARTRGVTAIACVRGQSWQWDGVRFEVLHPAAESHADARVRSNDRSCVVRVANARLSALLTGDIEMRSEQELISSLGAAALRSDVLWVPHHGSRTSSSAAFLDAVAPKLALIQAGYRNRFGHPRSDVLARYAERGIVVARTDWSGAITLDSLTGVDALRAYRSQRRRYWLDRPDPEDQRAMD